MPRLNEPYNLMEEMVKKSYDRVILEYPGACTCTQCQADVISLALNSLGSKYVSSSQGETRSRVELEGRQGQIDIWLALRSAINQVSQTPHHHRG